MPVVMESWALPFPHPALTGLPGRNTLPQSLTWDWGGRWEVSSYILENCLLSHAR